MESRWFDVVLARTEVLSRLFVRVQIRAAQDNHRQAIHADRLEPLQDGETIYQLHFQIEHKERRDREPLLIIIRRDGLKVINHVLAVVHDNERVRQARLLKRALKKK